MINMVTTLITYIEKWIVLFYVDYCSHFCRKQKQQQQQQQQQQQNASHLATVE